MGAETLQPAATLVDLDDTEILDVPEEEEEGAKSFEDIYAYLLENEDIILTIDEQDEDALRRGLSVVKHNHYKRLRKAGTAVEEKQIKFQVLSRVEGTDPQQIKLQIWLSKRASVRVHRIVVSDKGL